MDIVAVKDSELERYVTKIMLEIGVPAHLKGYHYLRDAIILSGKDMEVVSSVTKLLYPTIAKHFKTTDQKVERAIRNAIKVSWSRKCGDIRKDFWLFCSLRKDKTYEQRVHRTYRRQHPTGL